MKRVKLILLALAIFTNVFAQQSGSSFITNFQPAVYKAHSQNWAVVQDKRGVLFFGNGSGILEYDGITWQLHPMDVVRSLAMDNNGRIYVGLRGDFGYLQPDSLGNLQYKSLKDKIPAQDLE
ncbi:MAG TPA: hypothetical protein DCQ31_19225, partial [Bacteroidales bacterium]|nr:hypothetical protein [Bacteroidales bacterium]